MGFSTHFGEESGPILKNLSKVITQHVAPKKKKLTHIAVALIDAYAVHVYEKRTKKTKLEKAGRDRLLVISERVVAAAMKKGPKR
jgi:hypothetical protein